MATTTTEKRRIDDKLAIVDNGLNAAYNALQSISKSDIRATSYADGISLFDSLQGKIAAALSERKKLKYFS